MRRNRFPASLRAVPLWMRTSAYGIESIPDTPLPHRSDRRGLRVLHRPRAAMGLGGVWSARPASAAIPDCGWRQKRTRVLYPHYPGVRRSSGIL